MNKKIDKKVYIKSIYKYEFENTIDNIITFLNSLKKDYSQYSNLRLVDDDGLLELYGTRLETDSEFKVRIERERKIQEENRLRNQKQKEMQEKSEYKLFLRLKKKYENKKKV